MQDQYCNSLTEYSRFVTREVKVGDLILGGNNPIRLQSMTTTDTMNTEATVAQSIRMIEAGCELVRITAPSINEAKNLENIKKELLKRGYNTPLVADIHFTPNAAEVAARIVEKVRVNPGNYADKKKFETIDYTDIAYNKELDRIRERFIPLVRICKEYGTAMRIGTNHGSLSDRILSRYGDTPLGMVESALEFLRICEDENYHNIVLSMKASNTQVMVQAYRLLVNKMIETGRNYPLHLGVTEAGEGEDGRIKSAVGIGTLLEDGLGDTVRVSLTEDPEFEIPVARALVERYSKRELIANSHQPLASLAKLPYSPFDYKRRETIEVLNIGNHQVPRVVADFSKEAVVSPESFTEVGYKYSESLDKWGLNDRACDYIYLGKNPIQFEVPGTLRLIYDAETWSELDSTHDSFPLFTVQSYLDCHAERSEASRLKLSSTLNFIRCSTLELTPALISAIKQDKTAVLVLHTNSVCAMTDLRRAFVELEANNCKTPVIVQRHYDIHTESDFQLYSATDIGGLLIDGFGDGAWVSATEISKKTINDTTFGILQASRTRISKTEYISCPSCGRTLFDLQETTAKIRKRTDHLKGVKIGIMGCIVNGPGEMADADYGYVGVGVGKITLYRGRNVVKKGIESEHAVDELIELIKEDGNWLERE